MTALADAACDFRRVLCVEADMLFFKALPLSAVDLGDFKMAAVHDIAESGALVDPLCHDTCAQNGVSNDDFNAGLMLFDVAQIDVTRLIADFETLVAEHDRRCPYKSGCTTGEQCVWNQLFRDAWLSLPFCWNTQSALRFTTMWAQASARRYDGSVTFLPVRPWRSDLREARLIATISEGLGASSDALLGATPFDLVYRLNAWRRRATTQDVEAAARRIGRRIREQQATCLGPRRAAQAPSAPSLSMKATTSSTPTPWRIEAIT